MKEILVEQHGWPGICPIGNCTCWETESAPRITLLVCVGSLAACGDEEQKVVYLYCFITCGVFWLTDLCKGISLKLCVLSMQWVCVMHSVFRDWLSTHPNFSAVLVLKNMQVHHRKRVELKSSVIWKLFNTYDSWQSAVKEVSGHKGESRTTSPVCDALAGRIRRTTAQLRLSLSWSWEHQGALQPLPLLHTSPSNGACQWVPKTNCNPKSGCCGGATWGRVGGQLHPNSCFAGGFPECWYSPSPSLAVSLQPCQGMGAGTEPGSPGIHLAQVQQDALYGEAMTTWCSQVLPHCSWQPARRETTCPFNDDA